MPATPTNPSEQFARLNPEFQMLDLRDPTDRAIGRAREEQGALSRRVADSLSLESGGPAQWRYQVIERRANQAARREHDRQETFAELNPDFGVLPDSRDPQQHRFAQQRERAVALGERVAAAEQSGRERGEPADLVSFPRLPVTPPATAERAPNGREGIRQRTSARAQAARGRAGDQRQAPAQARRHEPRTGRDAERGQPDLPRRQRRGTDRERERD